MKAEYPELVLEEKHLKEVCSLLAQEISDKSSEISYSKSELVSIRKSMWENSKHGFSSSETEAMVEATQYLAAMKNEENSLRFAKNLMEKYRRLLHSPYFARVDFTEQGEAAPEAVYIGLYSFINMDTMEVVIHDWRAPVASIFYEYEKGPAAYEAGEGTVTGDITLKRQFKIRDSKLLYMFDSSVKIDDELLQEVLSGNASEKMKSIVATIQREQNSAIRFNSGSLLAVHGVAGSGKTSIALHRVAYLLYQDRNLSSNNIMIFSPNHIFNDYISNVLPELGEENVIQTTLDEYMQKILGMSFRMEGFSGHMEYLLHSEALESGDIRIKGYAFKNSESFLAALRAFGAEVPDAAGRFYNILYDGKIIIKGSELRKLYDGSDRQLPVNKRLSYVRARAFYLLDRIQEQKRVQVLKRVENEKVSPREADAAARLELQREFREVRDKIHGMTRLDLEEVYKRFFRSSYYLEAGKAYGLTADELEALGRQATYGVHGRRVHYEDTAVLVYLKSILDEIPDSAAIKHVVIDEAQDYSPLQYEVFKRLFPHSSFTILGDANQLINPYKRPEGFLKMEDIFGRADSVVIKLGRTYRSTREITEFTKEILSLDTEVEGLNRPGRLPELIRLSTACDRKKLLSADIKALQSEGMKSIAILCRTAGECRALFKLLDGEVELGMVVREEDIYKKGVNVLPSYYCKGLEFDAVIVYGADEENYRSGKDEKLLYTLCTRALHRLLIYCNDHPASIITGISSERYISRSC